MTTKVLSTKPAEGRRTGRRGGGRPTIADVARVAGVAAITVSRALREPSQVSAELRSQIDAAVSQLGYVLDPNARALATSRADVIGVLVPSLTNIVFADTVRGIYDELGSGRLQIQIANTHYSPFEEERLVRMFLGQRPTALIVAGLDQSDETRRLLESAGCPIVQIMEVGEDPVDLLVGFSHLEGGRTATAHLIEQGYRRICFFGARMDPRSQRRLAGYRLAMEEAGLFDPSLITTTLTPSSIPLGGQLFADACARVPDLDAIFCNNDDLALGALFECQRAGLAVPRQVGICGFNDLDMMSVAFPTLTSLRTPRYQIGRSAVRMVLDTIEGREPSQKIVDLGFQLMVRESTSRLLVQPSA